jgi:large subunit ribosomal protein L11
MAKEIVGRIKLQCPGGQATLAPPVGPALGQAGINPGQWVQQFNAKSASYNGTIVGVETIVYRDKTYEIIVKTPPASVLLKQAAQIAKGTGAAGKEVSGKVTRAQVAEIAKTKHPHLNAHDLAAAAKIIEGTARSMGLEVVD